ncbi:MAG: signal recognition particle protein [Planctomycetota bacterium]
MFEQISDTVNGALKKLSGQGTISEKNVRDAMEQVETSLLEADVHYDVVKKFCEEVVDEALGREVTRSLKPGQEMIGIVHRKLVELLGGTPPSEDEFVGNMDIHAEHPGIPRMEPGPTVVMMCGLQGSGKTTTCGKLAAYLRRQNRSVMLAAADLQRPAAVEQLETVATQVRENAKGSARVEFFGDPALTKEYGKGVGVAVDVCKNALKEARREGIDTLILDTAGRLHVNDELMRELNRIQGELVPHQIYLVVDAMTGQDAVNSAKAFHERLAVDGVILTKFDSDTRGGAAISVKEVTGAPIRFLGTGEKFDGLEEFHAERLAGRILGMGDVVSLVEKAQQEISEEEAVRLQEKMMKGEMSMDDFVKQLRMLRKMGPLKQLLGMLPGVGSALKDANIDEKQLDRTEAIVTSMTTEERRAPRVINHSRRRRIATGSGTDDTQVSGLVKQFDTLTKVTKQMAGLSSGGKLAAMQQMQAGGGMGGGLGRMKGSTKTTSPKKKFKQRKRR